MYSIFSLPIQSQSKKLKRDSELILKNIYFVISDYNIDLLQMRAIFPMTSMLSHSCHPNVEQTIGDHSGGLVLDMVTVRPVAKGEQIYISYTELLAPTLVRQHTLLTNKLFLCQCDR